MKDRKVFFKKRKRTRSTPNYKDHNQNILKLKYVSIMYLHIYLN